MSYAIFKHPTLYLATLPREENEVTPFGIGLRTLTLPLLCCPLP